MHLVYYLLRGVLVLLCLRLLGMREPRSVKTGTRLLPRFFVYSQFWQNEIYRSDGSSTWKCKNMVKLCISTRHELRLIPLDKVLIIEADGNYCNFTYVDGSRRYELSCLSFFEQNIKVMYSEAGINSPFCRLGRSYLVNTDFVRSVNLRTLHIEFSSDAVPYIMLSQRLLSRLKNFIDNQYRSVHSEQ